MRLVPSISSRRARLAGAALLAGAVAIAAVTAGCSRTGTGAGVRADITARMQSIQSPIQQCYATALQANRRLKGMMVVNFRAAASTGQFDQITNGRDEPADDTHRRCVIEQVSQLKLQTPQRTAVTVAYPLRFAPSN
jgi:hypothetical protein